MAQVIVGEAAMVPTSEFLDAAPGMVAWLRLDGTIVYVSAAAEDLVGRSPDDLIGTNAVELFEASDRLEIGRKLTALAVGPVGGLDRMTARIRRPDGSLVWAEVAARLAENPETGELGFAAVASETHERIEAERALRRIEERFQEMVELLPVVVYEAEPGPAGKFLYVSSQLEELLGYTPTEWIADPLLWATRLHPADRELTFRVEAEQAEIGLTSEAHLASEYRLIDRDGREVWVRDVARLCKPETGNPFWRGVLIDIGSERAAHQTLADAYERHRGIVEGLPACAYRAEAGTNGRWLFVSAHAEKLFGYRPDEILADPTLWPAFLHADDRDRVVTEDEWLATQPPGTELISEYRIRTRTGRTVWVRDRSLLVSDGNGSLMVDGIITDISAERAIAEASASAIDVYRLSCARCGQAWAAEQIGPCPQCGAIGVEALSLNAALGDLAASRRQVEGLLDGIHKHLEALGTNLRSGPTSLGVSTIDG
jgi:PAS domain S-box-containing protein